jgi:hypothetical protein
MWCRFWLCKQTCHTSIEDPRRWRSKYEWEQSRCCSIDEDNWTKTQQSEISNPKKQL